MLSSRITVLSVDSFDPAMFASEASFRGMVQMHLDATLGLYRKRKGRTMNPMTCNYCMRDPVKGIDEPRLFVLTTSGPGDPRELNAQLTFATRHTCTFGKAVCTVLVSEINFVKAKSADDARAARVIGVQRHPERGHGLMVRANHTRWFALGLSIVGPSGPGEWKLTYDPKDCSGFGA